MRSYKNVTQGDKLLPAATATCIHPVAQIQYTYVARPFMTATARWIKAVKANDAFSTTSAHLCNIG